MEVGPGRIIPHVGRNPRGSQEVRRAFKIYVPYIHMA